MGKRVRVWAGGTWLLAWVVLLSGVTVTAAHAQSRATASRAGDLQVGVGGTFGTSPYGQPDPAPTVLSTLSLRGFAVYSTFDFKEHFGVEVDFHQVSASQDPTIYERTYEVGARYGRIYGRFHPYAKLMVGRGVFNYQQNEANLAYNLVAPGVGTDFRLRRSINLRADYEYQFWQGFPLVSQRPQLFTIGVAYHFGD